MQQKQGVATGVAHPQPAQQLGAAAEAEVQQKQGVATGVAHPQPAQHQDVPGGAAPAVHQKEASASK